MKLLSFDYEENGFKPWKLEGLKLSPNFNLLTGLNGTGKSLTISKLIFFKNLILNRFFYENDNFEISATFSSSKSPNLNYRVQKIKGSYTERIISQYDSKDEAHLFVREAGKVKLFSINKGEWVKIDIPEDELGLTFHRDKTDFPFIEELVEWAKTFDTDSFLKIDRYFLKENRNESILTFLEKNEDIIIQVHKKLIDLGYPIETILPQKDTGGKISLFLKEKNVPYYIEVDDLSEGMKRALGTLIKVEVYNFGKEYPELLPKERVLPYFIVLDDFAEGLDYDRASKLTQYLIEESRNLDVQILVASNDRFLMNEVPIENWNILKRKGSTVKAYNYYNSKSVFDDFAFTGLSNFDFFSMDFLSPITK